LIRKGPKNPVRGTEGDATRKDAELETSQRGRRDDPEAASGDRLTLGGGAKAERAVKKVRRFADGLGQERRPRCGGPKKVIAAGERKAGFKRGLRLPLSCDGLGDDELYVIERRRRGSF